jgi:transposase-like protein
METQRQWCDQPSCRDFGQIGAHNIRIYRDVERRYYCATCHATFSAEKATFFDTRRTDRNMRLDAVARLVERNSRRAIGRIKPCKPNTGVHWLDLAGQHAATVSNHFIRGLPLTQAQSDELWTFVTKNRNTFNRTIPTISVMPGSGERLLCPVICVWAITSPMIAVRKRPPHAWWH